MSIARLCKSVRCIDNIYCSLFIVDIQGHGCIDGISGYVERHSANIINYYFGVPFAVRLKVSRQLCCQHLECLSRLVGSSSCGRAYL
ncbi:hypothetical protein R1flu_004289 [Riccia fluitans]|uniref:Uncharacterized protein n=1 Tax=Riccia fluitans TaxID=41844 RepID=A0ABD1YPV0_9MARC